MSSQTPLTLDQQRDVFRQSKFLAMPIAGAIAWFFVGIGGLFLNVWGASMLLYACTGMIFYLGLLVAKFTNEDLLGKTKQSNFFDQIFLLTVVQAVLVYAIAIPFVLIEPTSLPLTVGILTGLMWIPFSGLIQHWVGLFHGLTRTILVLVLWYVFPEHRFIAIPFAIVTVYAVTIYVLATRERGSDSPAPTEST